MADNLDITSISTADRRRHFKRIQDAIDLKVANDNGGVPKYHLSLITGQSAITEHVVLHDGRKVPYSLSQQRYYEQAFRTLSETEDELPEIPYSGQAVNRAEAATDAAQDYLSQIKFDEDDNDEQVRI
jgi:hypothetical protein